MKKRYLLICFVFALSPVMAQKAYFDSLKHLVVNAKTDSEKFRGISELINNYYGRYNPDSSIIYGNQLTAWGKKLNNKSIMVTGLRGVAFGMYNKGDYPGALNNGLNALRIIENTHDTVSMAWTYSLVGDIYKGQQNYSRALYYYQHAKQLSRTFRGLINWSEPDLNLAFVYERTNALDSALYYAERYLSYKDNLGPKGSANYMYGILGNVYFKLKKYDTALKYYRKGYNIAKNQRKSRGVSEMGINLSNFYAHTNKPDSAIYYARQALLAAKKVSYNKSVYEAAALLGSLYESMKIPDSAFKYLKLSSVTKDSLYNAAKAGEVANLTVGELARQNEIQAANAAYRSSLRIYMLGGALLVFLAMALLQWINSGQKKRAYILLKKQKEEIEAQRAQALIEAALEKVRGRAMAMHKTDELLDAAELLYKELTGLGISSMAITYSIMDEEEKSALYYSINPVDGKVNPMPLELTHTETDVMRAILASWKKKETSNLIELDEEATLKHQTYIGQIVREALTRINIPFSVEEFLAVSPKKAVIYTFNFAQGYIFIIGNGRLTAEQEEMVLRFTKVFELTYRRFLDIKQAEEQARESQIQLALERVRARTMAMQQSDELAETVFILFQQFKELGENPDQATIGIINEEDQVIEYSVTMYGTQTNQVFKFSIDEPNVTHKIYEGWKAHKKSIVIDLSGKELHDFATYRESMGGARYNKDEKRRIINVAFFSKGLINVQSTEGRSEESIRLLERFTGVFDGTYTRFLDLQKAEAQAKEAQIELGLERVRSRSLAMHTSNELQEVVNVVFEKLNELGITMDSVNILIPDEATKGITHWVSNPDKSYSTSVYAPFFDSLIVSDFWRAKADGADFITKTYTREEKNNYFEYAFAHTDFKNAPDDRKKQILAGEGYGASWAITKNAAIVIINYSGNLFLENENGILKRFANVFEQAYVRFLDLQKAEAQAREGQIQLALERVRARAMAMQSTEELSALVGTVFEELTKLDFVLTRCLIMIFDPQTLGSRWWMANSEDPANPMSFFVQNHNSPVYNSYVKAWGERLAAWRYELKGKVKQDWDNFLFVDTELSHLPAAVIKGMTEPGKVLLSAAFNNFGCLTLVSLEPLSNEHSDIMLRFAKVFDMSYTRFNDLKQAEEQFRESQIQLGLERVRARAMAMQSSEELNALVRTMFEELTKLDFVLMRCAIMIFDPETLDSRWWMVNSEATAEPVNFFVPNNNNTPYQAYLGAWRERALVWHYELKGKVKRDWDEYLFADTELSRLPQAVVDGMKAPEKVFWTASFNTFGCLRLVSMEPLPGEHTAILLRFAKVFDMSYTRFNDLKQAEMQAREAKIEASLERVRAKTMAMHNSADIGNTAASMFDELVKLGIETSVRCGVLIIDKTKHMEVWAAASDKEGKASLLIGSLDMSIHPLLQQLYTAWENKEPRFIHELRGDYLKSYYRAITEAPDYPFQYDLQSIPSEQMTNLFFFPEGGIFAFTVEPLSEDVANLFKRFAAVFGLTYRRFLDLQKAEAQTREAVKQASVDRVRAEIASMRSTTDLERITPLLWNELTILGIPFIRSGVFIIDEEAELIHAYLSTPDGKALGTFDLQFDSKDIAGIVLPAWRNKQIATNHWSAEEFAGFTQNLVERGTVKPKERYVTEHPDTSLDLHFFPFLQGMLYVGNSAPLDADAMGLVQSLAEAFSTAYARYEDFNKLELAKLQVDKTLTELKATQNQLIQSEKMASLGELTAGVAHEIQNPLNFVNNFSEVSMELLDEMQTELESGDKDEAIAIAADVKQNLEKIRHHGQRADRIVKGMLQHSRASNDTKEPADINKLADEYLHLAYHGLRAKDKNFNCELVTTFDEKLPRVNMVPQDIGRVLINLYNNAFYATQQKAKTAGTGYKPEVMVTTCKEDGQVIIKVKDNGNGIPDAVKDKIMQPFFTTKPTGEGTGLGLSLSYDIVVKGHQGSISVNSIAGGFTEFIVTLPI